MSIIKTSDHSEEYDQFLRFIEEELMIKGGRWIATFDHSIRNFNIQYASKEKTLKQKKDFDLLVYGGVRSRGFFLSAAFSFLASPTYRVGCAVINLKNASNVKWSILAEWIRDVQDLMDLMEFEWIWILFFGEGKIPPKTVSRIESYSKRTLGLLYADIRNKTLLNSNSFISRRGSKLFHPKNLNKIKSKRRFWNRNKGD
ncbi:MAG: hypothetical protein ACXAC8_06830 [Candidatus Hodarchaeales archaeon]